MAAMACRKSPTVCCAPGRLTPQRHPAVDVRDRLEARYNRAVGAFREPEVSRSVPGE